MTQFLPPGSGSIGTGSADPVPQHAEPPPVIVAPRDPIRLQALRERARAELASLNYPPADWVPLSLDADHQPMLDVLIVGAGMCGQTAAFALLREGVRKLRVIDAAPRGQEGPWGTFARMPTLRSPKHLTGADLGLASMTYRAWHEAAYGDAHWQALHKISTTDWLDYLLWVRDVTGVPVDNLTRLISAVPGPDGVRVELDGPAGREVLSTRKLVLAMGRDGSGGERWPTLPGLDPTSKRRLGKVFHSDEVIDFESLRSRRVAVLGAGASAFDNAGTALEAGAAQVVQYVRRPFLPQVNKSKWTSFPGFLHGFIGLDDARRWSFYTYIFDEQVPPPWESVLRCDRHPQFELRLGQSWSGIEIGDDSVTVRTQTGAETYDVLIVATGFDVDLALRTELASMAGNVMLWRDRIGETAAAAHPEPARFPYLGAGFELIEREPGALPGAQHVHLYNWGATMSHGAIAGDIPGLGLGAGRLARAIVQALFVADADKHHARMLAHNEDELQATRRFVSVDRRRR